MKKILIILLTTISLQGWTQIASPDSLSVGGVTYMDSVFIRNDSLILRTTEGKEFGIARYDLPCDTVTNLVTNSGVVAGGYSCNTDWTDSNSDGVADDWTFASGGGACSIVTGNGFTGNAQQITHVNGTLTSVTYNTGAGTESADYRLIMKYRASTASWRIYIKGTTQYFTLNLPAVTGNAQYVAMEANFAVGPANLVLNFYRLSGAANSTLQIDEVYLKKL